MAAALDPKRRLAGDPGGPCLQRSRGGRAGFISGYDAYQDSDSLELLGGERHIVLGVRAADLGELDNVQIEREIYNVFTIESERNTRIEDYLRRDDALAAAGLA